MAIFFHCEILMKTIHLRNICLVAVADYRSSWQLIPDFVLKNIIIKKKKKKLQRLTCRQKRWILFDHFPQGGISVEAQGCLI